MFGRKPVLDAGERRKIAERYAAGETMAELARDYDCGVATIHRVLGIMKLAIGKRYRSRSGQVTTPLFQTPGDDSISRLQPFAGYFVDDDKAGYRTWSEEGESVNGWIMHRDLVEEISESDQRWEE